LRRKETMTIDKARELLLVQTGFGGFYNANSTKLILAEVTREHGQAAVDQLIRECEPERVLGLPPEHASMAGLPASRSNNKSNSAV
jgi:hypothetical protein